MLIIQYTIIFILGIIIGSFLNVCIYRIPKEESIAYPPSHCGSCNTRLKPIDLVPMLSFFFYRGKCRYCGEKLSLQYPIIEALNGIIYLFLFVKFGQTIFFVEYALLSSLLIVIGIIDFKYKLIYDNTIIFGVVCAVVFIFLKGLKYNLLNGLIGAAVGGGFFLIIMLITRGAMGGGDVELMALLGLFLGWKLIILTTMASFCLGALISIFLIVLKLKDKKDYIPFGPFIALAAFLTICYGNEIINWYMINFVI